MQYDFDIRNTFNEILGDDAMHDLLNNINDYDLLRLSIELLRFATERLSSDLNDNKINEEYIKLKFIIEQLEKIEKTYV